MPEIKRFSGFKLLMLFRMKIRRMCILRGLILLSKIRLSNGELIAGA